MLSDVEDNAETIQKDSGSNFLLDGGSKIITQDELNDLVHDLGLSKDFDELFGSRLKEKNLLCAGLIN